MFDRENLTGIDSKYVRGTQTQTTNVMFSVKLKMFTNFTEIGPVNLSRLDAGRNSSKRQTTCTQMG